MQPFWFFPALGTPRPHRPSSLFDSPLLWGPQDGKSYVTFFNLVIKSTRLEQLGFLYVMLFKSRAVACCMSRLTCAGIFIPIVYQHCLRAPSRLAHSWVFATTIYIKWSLSGQHLRFLGDLIAPCITKDCWPIPVTVVLEGFKLFKFPTTLDILPCFYEEPMHSISILPLFLKQCSMPGPHCLPNQQITKTRMDRHYG